MSGLVSHGVGESFYVEPAEEIAVRSREALQYVPPEKVFVNSDCGFFQLPRWLTGRKLQRMVAGAQIVRHELAG